MGSRNVTPFSAAFHPTQYAEGRLLIRKIDQLLGLFCRLFGDYGLKQRVIATFAANPSSVVISVPENPRIFPEIFPPLLALWTTSVTWIPSERKRVLPSIAIGTVFSDPCR
jgi:hypothetical protein